MSPDLIAGMITVGLLVGIGIAAERCAEQLENVIVAVVSAGAAPQKGDE